MAANNLVKEILARPIQVADQVAKMAEEAGSFKQECLELKAKSERVATLLRQAARASSDLYERPTRRIVDETEQALERALALVSKCRGAGGNFLKRLFTIIPAAAFRKSSAQLENSVGDVSWLLRVSANERGDEYLGLPPIAANEPILCLIWEQIAILHTGSVSDRSDGAASLVSLARDNARYGRLIVEEGGVAPLLKLAKEGSVEGQEHAARAIGLLGREPDSVEQILSAGVCSVFAKILKEGHMSVQSVVAWAVSELASNHPKCQDHFAQSNAIRLLVSHLAFETIQEHSKYAVAAKQQQHTSIHSLLLATKLSQGGENLGSNPGQIHGAMGIRPHAKGVVGTPMALAGASIKGREFEDPATKAEMKAMAARALWKLAKNNVAVCRSITESRALLCFAVLLEKGPEEVRAYSAMALMEIAAVAEHNSDLRRSAFKPTSPAARAVVDQLLRIVKEADSDLVVPCVKAIGSLARTFRATETRMIAPLVKLLDEREPEVSAEAVMALNKFACTENFLHVRHSKAVIDGGGTKHLIQLVYFGEQAIQIPALMLLCYISLHVPDSEVLAQEEVLIVLEWSTKQSHLAEDPSLVALLPEAKSRLELYQSRGSRGFH